MAVAYDSVGTAPTDGGTPASISWAHTTIGASTYVFACAQLDNSSDAGFTMAAKLDGVTMTSLGTEECGGAGAGFLQAWYLGGITAGAHTIAVTVSGGTPHDTNGGSVAVTGAVAAGTPVPAEGTSIAASASVAGTGSSNLVVAFTAVGDTIASQTGGTSSFILNYQGGAGFAAGNCAGGYYTSASGSVAVGWALTTSGDTWAIIAVEAQAAAAAGGSGPPVYPRPSGRVVTVPFAAGRMGAAHSR